MMQLYYRGMKCHLKPLNKIPQDKQEVMFLYAWDQTMLSWQSDEYRQFWKKYLGL